MILSPGPKPSTCCRNWPGRPHLVKSTCRRIPPPRSWPPATLSAPESPSAAAGCGKTNTDTIPGIYEKVQDLDIGQVGGPIRLEEGYSVFKLVEREEEQVKPFNRATQRQARALVKIQKKWTRYAQYMESLREIYPVRIMEENLVKLDRLAPVNSKERNAARTTSSSG